VRLALLFWFYKDLLVCQNRLRLWRRLNPDVPIYGLYGGPVEQGARFAEGLECFLDDFWAFPPGKDPRWKWRNGDLVLREWFVDRGKCLEWDTVFVAQWDLVAVRPLRAVLPAMQEGEMLLSGLRPIHEVETWWRWTQGDHRAEYLAFMDSVRDRFGELHDPPCCQFIGIVAPRSFLSLYGGGEPSELGFLEYKVPVLARAWGIPFVEDTCFRPWWPEDPSTAAVKRTERLVHAWPNSLRLPTMLYEAHRPHGRRIFHPYRGIYPHDLESLQEMRRRARPGAEEPTTESI
jgi:hypothetical protein